MPITSLYVTRSFNLVRVRFMAIALCDAQPAERLVFAQYLYPALITAARQNLMITWPHLSTTTRSNCPKGIRRMALANIG